MKGKVFVLVGAFCTSYASGKPFETSRGFRDRLREVEARLEGVQVGAKAGGS